MAEAENINIPNKAASVLDEIQKQYEIPITRDLGDEAEFEMIYQISDHILAKHADQVDDLNKYINESDETLPANLIAAVKNAQSAQEFAQCDPCHLTVVFAMYHEVQRAQKRNKDNAEGQNFVVNKEKQLAWLFKANPKSTYEIIAVDDGCDQDSRGVVNGIIEENKLGKVFKTLHLQDPIDQKMGIFSKLETTKDSRKGGAILYGLHDASLKAEDKEHLVVYTDADLSADLAMCGSLAHRILKNGSEFSCGVRYGMLGSFLVKEKGAIKHPQSHLTKPDAIHVAFRHFLRAEIIPPLGPLTDTNCGLKCWKAKDLQELISNMSVFGPAFDMELLFNALKYYGKADDMIGLVPILFVEDFECSNFSKDPNETFHRIATEMCAMSDEHIRDEDLSEFGKKLKTAVKSWTLEDYTSLCQGIETTFGRAINIGRKFTMKELEACIALKKQAVDG